MTGKTYICQSCGKEVYGGRNGKYCEACSREIKNERRRQERHARKIQGKQPATSIGAIAKKAREMGMSYGEFVAKYDFT